MMSRLKKINSWFFLSIIFFTFSCTKSEFDEFVSLNSGNANFSTYIAVGNSLTQGYQDGGLHNEYQQQSNSYPAIIARQMQTSFSQPLVEASGSGHKSLQDLAPTLIDVSPNASWIATGWATWDKTANYNNLGIAGIKLTDAVPTAGNPTSPVVNQVVNSLNPFGGFLDFGTALSPVSYLDHIKSSNATFFTCWLGNNDVLAWSIAGGDDGEVAINGLPPVKLSELTPVAVFRSKYDSVLDAFEAMGAKGVCATLPDVTSIPFFTTVTLAAIGADVYLTEGADTTVVRQATNEDLILLTTQSAFNPVTGHGFVAQNPLTHQEVLDKDEVAIVQNHINLLNAEIKASAAAHGVAVVDMNAFMAQLDPGLVFDGVEFTAEFIQGGAFSLDGIHPNSRGYAILANKFIEGINAAYGANIRPVAVQNYRGIIFP